VDQPEDVIVRLLDFYEREKQSDKRKTSPASLSSGASSRRADVLNVATRSPRERGGRVQIGGHDLSVVSIADLYTQALRLLLAERAESLAGLVPFRTSSVRYLVSKQPVHPNGADFVRPIDHAGFYMETHKDYRNAISHLGKLVEKCGLPFRYLGS
jgi:hypothetical protein